MSASMIVLGSIELLFGVVFIVRRKPLAARFRRRHLRVNGTAESALGPRAVGIVGVIGIAFGLATLLAACLS